ncbi:hypothetical protein [Mycetocola sp. JXN-3]|uniref:hypothetical protein n=1 Tax=Mycetocola sp. JXN-3 TaxID=2116510 RepID=UPI00165D2AC2|nr:hypothetical protein [Mycetocola sp. JXN-3]
MSELNYFEKALAGILIAFLATSSLLIATAYASLPTWGAVLLIRWIWPPREDNPFTWGIGIILTLLATLVTFLVELFFGTLVRSTSKISGKPAFALLLKAIIALIYLVLMWAALDPLIPSPGHRALAIVLTLFLTPLILWPIHWGERRDRRRKQSQNQAEAAPASTELTTDVLNDPRD